MAEEDLAKLARSWQTTCAVNPAVVLSLSAVSLACLAGCAEGDAPPLSQASAEATAEPSSTAEPSAVPPEASASAEVVIPPPGTPIVDLGGITNLPAPIPEGAPRLGALDWVTRVYATPDREGKELGFLRAGAVVAATGSETTRPSKGCEKGFRNIEPAGFVCMNDVTDDLQHPVLRAAARGPDYTYRLPYMYGTVTRGGPVYAKIPNDEELKKHEPSLAKHYAKWKDDKESGATYGLDVWLRYTPNREVHSAIDALRDKITDEELIPWFLKADGRVPNVSGLVKSEDAVKIDQVNRRQGRSFIYSFLHEGRRYNVTPDLTVIPADRFRPIRGSDFHGWRLGESELEFPFALIRRKGAKKWIWRGSGKSPKEAGSVDYRSAVQLTAKQQIHDGKLYYETTDGHYVDARHASKVEPAKRWPKWAQQGAKWIDVRLSTQVLVAYEGQKMVFATLISSGEDGLADHEGTTATKKGIFRIHTKHVSITMDSDTVGEEFELRDVPYVQYFEGGYALHGAYWHDGFGRPKSHGCINLAPEDARRLFFWTDPPVPVGWHGAMKSLTGTVVFVHP